jgi:hypothetical protein
MLRNRLISGRHSRTETVQKSQVPNSPEPRDSERFGDMPKTVGPVTPSHPSTLSASSSSHTPKRTLESSPSFSIVNRVVSPLLLRLQSSQKAIEAPTTKTSPARLWSNLTPDERTQAEFDYVACKSGRVVFSLNFSAKRHAGLMASGNPTRSLSIAINEAAKKLFGAKLPMFFTFEFNRAQRLHCHGIAILPLLTDDMLKLFRQVLKTAGGKITGLGSGRQCDVQDLYDVDGWQGYCGKESERTRRLLGMDKITFVSADLRREAEAAHNAAVAVKKVQKPMTAETATETQGVASAATSPATPSGTSIESQHPSTGRYESRADDWTLDISDYPAITGGISAAALAEIELLLDDL